MHWLPPRDESESGMKVSVGSASITGAGGVAKAVHTRSDDGRAQDSCRDSSLSLPLGETPVRTLRDYEALVLQINSGAGVPAARRGHLLGMLIAWHLHHHQLGKTQNDLNEATI